MYQGNISKLELDMCWAVVSTALAVSLLNVPSVSTLVEKEPDRAYKSPRGWSFI